MFVILNVVQGICKVVQHQSSSAKFLFTTFIRKYFLWFQFRQFCQPANIEATWWLQILKITISLINCKYLKLNSQFLVASNLSTIGYHPKMMEHNFVDFQTPPSHNVSVSDVGHKGGDPSWVLLEQLMLLSVHLKHL